VRQTGRRAVVGRRGHGFRDSATNTSRDRAVLWPRSEGRVRLGLKFWIVSFLRTSKLIGTLKVQAFQFLCLLAH